MSINVFIYFIKNVFFTISILGVNVFGIYGPDVDGVGQW